MAGGEPQDVPTADGVVVHRVPAAAAGTRLDAFLRDLGVGSLQRARRLAEAAAVAVGGVVAGPRVHLREGDVVTLRPATVEATLQLGIAVVHRDDDVLVLHKPPGLAVHGGPLVDRSVAGALATFAPGAGLAHRLDRGASGLLLCGLHAGALRRLAGDAAAGDGDGDVGDDAAARGPVERDYLAVTAGVPGFDRRTIDLPLRVLDEPRGDRPKTVVDASGGARAVTHVEVLARGTAHALVRARLATGRTHQIRAHLAAIGTPLLGDPRYGDPAANERARVTHGVARPLLHSSRLALRPPGVARAVELVAFAEPDLARLFPAAVPSAWRRG